MTIFHVVNRQVVRIQTHGICLVQGNLCRLVIVIIHIRQMDIIGFCILILAQHHIGTTFGHGCHGEIHGGSAVFQKHVLIQIDGGAAILDLQDGALLQQTMVGVDITLDGGAIGRQAQPLVFGSIIVEIVERVHLVGELGCIQLYVKAGADGLAHINIARSFLHMQGNADHNLTGIVTVS